MSTYLMNPIFESDCLVHTHHSPCAKDKPNSHLSRMLAHAERLGMKVVGFADHAPGNALGNPDAYMSQIRDGELYEIAELALENQVAMEVNGHLDREPEYLHAMKRFYRICRAVGVKLTLGSDAHRLQSLGSSNALESAISFLELEPSDFMTADELLSKPRKFFAEGCQNSKR